MKWCKQLSLAVLMTAVAALPAFGQSSTSSITGTVTDPGGGVIPGATVTVTGDAGFSATVVTNSEGAYTFPALQPATYKVTVTLQGFKTAIIENVRVISGNPSAVNVKLEVGRLEENVTVKSSTELINTQTATVSATLNADQLNRMPTTSRNALNAVTFLPGVNTSGVNRNSTVNGLPESMLNITLDGVSNQDNFNKTTDGFFASVYPRQDAVEAVTVTSAVSGANLGGSGAVTIAFTTRSGTNRFSGSAYEYFRHPDLNSNNWANKTVNNTGGLPKNQTKLNQYRRARRRADQDSGPVRWQRQGVLLLPLRRAALPEQLHEDAVRVGAADAGRPVLLHRGHWCQCHHPVGEPAGARRPSFQPRQHPGIRRSGRRCRTSRRRC